MNFSLATGIKPKADEKLLTAPCQQGPGAIHHGVPVEGGPTLTSCGPPVRTTPNLRLHQEDLS